MSLEFQWPLKKKVRLDLNLDLNMDLALDLYLDLMLNVILNLHTHARVHVPSQDESEQRCCPVVQNSSREASCIAG